MRPNAWIWQAFGTWAFGTWAFGIRAFGTWAFGIRAFGTRAFGTLVFGVLGAAAVLTAGAARAGGVNHFEVAAGPHNYIVTNHPSVLPHLVPSAWLLTAYARDPLVFRDEQGNQLGDAVVEHQISTEIAAALGLFDRFEVAMVAPAVFVSGAGFDGKGLQEFTTGDLRLLAKALLTPSNEGVVASFRLQSDLIPIAQLNRKAGALAGDPVPNVTPAFSVGFNSDVFRLGVDLGMLVRAPKAIDTITIGSQVLYGAGGEVSILPKVLFATLDLNGRLSPAFLGSNSDQFPLELNGAVKFFNGPILLMAGGGAGLIPGYGAPDARAFIALGYFDRPDDRDGDGIKDIYDKCPDEPEDKDGFEDSDGCPDEDNDKDGILDRDDKCPDDAEDIDRWEDEDGCPEDDNDADGIKDDVDDCPNDPEVVNGFEDEDGCPDEATRKKLVVVKRERIEINDKIFFAFDSDRILPRSYELLDNVASVIKDHTEIAVISIEGHTDDEGTDAYNLELSERRAKSVMRYLVDAGVDINRLRAQGFGESRPIDESGTEDGMALNRRVEFRIVGDAEGDPAP